MNDIDPEKLLGETRKAIDMLDAAADRQTFIDKFTQRVSFDSEDFYQLVQGIRESLPQELEAAQEIIEKRDTIIENAKSEHEEILEAAYQRQEDLVSDEAVLKKAKVEAEKIIDEAEEEARQMRTDAIRYSRDNLEFLEERLSDTLKTIRNGLDYLDSELEESREEPLGEAESTAEPAGADRLPGNEASSTDESPSKPAAQGREEDGGNANRGNGVE